MIKSDKEALIVLSGIFTNLSSAWFAAIPVVSILYGNFSWAQFIELLTINGAAGIVGIVIAIWLLKKGK